MHCGRALQWAVEFNFVSCLRLECAFEPGVDRLLRLDLYILRRVLFKQTPEARRCGFAARRAFFWHRLSALQLRNSAHQLLVLVFGSWERFVVAEQREGRCILHRHQYPPIIVAIGKVVEKRQESPCVLTAGVGEKVINEVVEYHAILWSMACFEPAQQILLVRHAHSVAMSGVGKYEHELQRDRDPNVPVAAVALPLASLDVALHKLPLHVLRGFRREQIERGGRELRP